MELEEAAMLDGAGRLTIIRTILLPLVMPGLIATSVFAFITAWNDYLFAYVLMKDQSHYTLPVWLVSFSTSTGTDYGGLIAASTLFALPRRGLLHAHPTPPGRRHDRRRRQRLTTHPHPRPAPRPVPPVPSRAPPRPARPVPRPARPARPVPRPVPFRRSAPKGNR
ncbi:ABC transporter permease subunit [Streptacidiphilus sp. P02-A3a]|uniref:ABC transporter permease subunit n=1 Tax=Streptacidiphilus sp. P02-A3a TaxID=2704468 RepID=UPI00351A2668